MSKVIFGGSMGVEVMPELGKGIRYEFGPVRTKEIRGTFLAISPGGVFMAFSTIYPADLEQDPIARWVPWRHTIACEPDVAVLMKEKPEGRAVELIVSEWIYDKIMQEVRQNIAKRQAERYDGEKASLTAAELMDIVRGKVASRREREAQAAARMGKAAVREKERLDRLRRERVERDRKLTRGNIIITAEEMTREAMKVMANQIDTDTLDDWTGRTTGSTAQIKRPWSIALEPKKEPAPVDFSKPKKRRFNFDE